MNILIAIASCEAHAERAKVCVETWAKTWDGPYYMQRGLAPDQAAIYNEPINLCVHVFDGRKLNVGDEYKDLPAKIQAICGWALKRKYGWLLKVDTDTFVWIDRIMASGFEKFDYRGFELIDYENGFAILFWVPRPKFCVRFIQQIDFAGRTGGEWQPQFCRLRSKSR